LDGLFAPIDAYCERAHAGFWAEPANALTNLAFIAAGLWGLREARRRRAGAFAVALPWGVVVIGLGSALFHTFANRLTALADVIPIAVFALAYTLFNLRFFLGLSWPGAWASLILFHAAAALLAVALPGWLHAATNGSTSYLPALLALLVFGAIEARQGHPAGWFNLAAAAIFMVSAVFRVLDPAACDAVPLGTHFLWHLLNATMLGLLLAAATRFGPARPTQKTGSSAGGALP